MQGPKFSQIIDQQNMTRKQGENRLTDRMEEIIKQFYPIEVEMTQPIIADNRYF